MRNETKRRTSSPMPAMILCVICAWFSKTASCALHTNSLILAASRVNKALQRPQHGRQANDRATAAKIIIIMPLLETRRLSIIGANRIFYDTRTQSLKFLFVPNSNSAHNRRAGVREGEVQGHRRRSGHRLRRAHPQGIGRRCCCRCTQHMSHRYHGTITSSFGAEFMIYLLC